MNDIQSLFHFSVQMFGVVSDWHLVVSMLAVLLMVPVLALMALVRTELSASRREARWLGLHRQ